MTMSASNAADKNINAANTNQLTGSNDSTATSTSTIGEVHGESTLGDQDASGYADNSVKDVLLVVSPSVTKGDRSYYGSATVGLSTASIAAIGLAAIIAWFIIKRRRVSNWEY